ncbi:MAG: hypothetical protein I8H75_02210 [Myxococcaceae bacterium]|nr:hypothetical protein [Myxococcaceae bacterium]MBH2006150.1 hypothetical protein [Myxococcaceae bacterium]
MRKWKLSFGRFFAVSFLAAGLSWLLWDRVPSLVYFFNGHPTQIEGVLGNRAGEVSGFLPGTFWLGPIEIRNVLGQPYFVATQKPLQPFTQIKLHGRLVDFGEESQFRTVRRFFIERLGMIIPEGAQLLLVGEEPMQQWRYPMLFGLAFLVFGVVLIRNLSKHS